MATWKKADSKMSLIDRLAAKNAPPPPEKPAASPKKPRKTPAPEPKKAAAPRKPPASTRTKRDDAEYFQQLLDEQNRDIVEWWDAQSSLGPKPLITTPEELWDAAREYFVWNEKHPLWEQKVFAYKGETTREPLPRMRAMSLEALCHFLDIPTNEWENLRKNGDLLPTCKRIEEVIYSQKLQGASADLMNANIIARDLQLKDHKEHSGPGGGPVQHEDVSSLELAKAVAQILARGVNVLDLKPVNGHDTESLQGSGTAGPAPLGAAVAAERAPTAPDILDTLIGPDATPTGEEQTNGSSDTP